jgi:four helix bundle protein
MYQKLKAYKIAFNQAMTIFEITKSFPKDEKYSLTDQVRRSSRSVCANISEGYRKRQYKAHFISKISDSDMENTETRVWLQFALSCNYLKRDQFDSLIKQNESIGRILNFMMHNPERFMPKSNL